MLKNYLLITLRNLIKEKVFTTINLLGLAVGITCFITLMLFVFDELGYDTFHKNADNIYRVYVHSNINGEESVNPKSAVPIGPTLKNTFAEVENFTRIAFPGNLELKYGDKVFREVKIYAVDSTYFEVFDFPLIAGDRHTLLVNPYSIVLTETAARRYFGDENPLGKTIIVDDKDSYLVTGVMKDFPNKSHFACDFLMSMSTFPQSESQYWLDQGNTTYIVLREGANPEEFQKKMSSLVSKYLAPQVEKVIGISMKDFIAKGNIYEYLLQPLTSIYLYSEREYGLDMNAEWGQVKSSDIAYVYIVSIIAFSILLLAVINFINLSTAKSEKRAKEVGIRKTLGSDRKKLIGQFIVESITMVFFSVIIALVLLELVLPAFNSFIRRDLSLDFINNLYTIPLLIIFILIVGLLAGSYPAFYLSSFQPVQVIKPSYSGKNRKQSLRSLMVIGQFAVSIILITGTIIINNQLQYIQNKNLGFDKEHLLSINYSSALQNRLEPLKNELAENPNVLATTNSSLMFQSGIPGSGYLFNERAGMNIVSSQYLNVDYDFLKTYQIELKEGRYFSEDFASDSNAVLINESAVKEFNAGNAIGKFIAKINNKDVPEVYNIIGVIKDFNYQSLHEKVRPLILYLSEVRQATSVLTIRINSKDMVNTVKYIEEKWKNYFGEEHYSLRFVNDRLARMYENDERIRTITMIFSFLAVFIACLGLFGLVAFIAEQKTKEIGIRKVLGASIAEILFLLSKQFTRWIIISSIIACPIAYYFMENWLQDFAYRIEIGWSIFVIAGLVALFIAFITISFQTIKAALSNPVKSLKYE
jgi:putative ABC transport system permease protein